MCAAAAKVVRFYSGRVASVQFASASSYSRLSVPNRSTCMSFKTCLEADSATLWTPGASVIINDIDC